MNSIVFLQQSLESSRAFAMGLLLDLQDAPLARPTAEGGNHAAWIIAHLAFSEAQLFDVFIQGKANRYESWGRAVGLKSEPTSNADDYPSLEEGVAMFDAVRNDVMTWLQTIDEDTLDEKSHAPEDYADSFGTVAKCCSALVIHMGLHAGQLAVIRKSLGREPLKA